MTRDTERHRAQIWGMYVVSEEQGKGIGRLLLTDAIRRASLLSGLGQIELEVVSRNKVAKHLYASLSFESCGINPRTRLVGGEYLDDERMVLFLQGR